VQKTAMSAAAGRSAWPVAMKRMAADPLARNESSTLSALACCPLEGRSTLMEASMRMPMAAPK